jgi:hypothetical protein
VSGDPIGDTEVRARLLPAGAGALVFALYFVLGGCGIGIALGPVIDAIEPPSALRTALVGAQAALVVGWLVFVVWKAVRGGVLVVTRRELRVKKLLFWKRHALTGDSRLARFVHRTHGREHFLGPVLVLTTSGGGSATVACISQDLHERLGVSLEDDVVLAADAVVEPEAFAAVYRLQRGVPAAG